MKDKNFKVGDEVYYLNFFEISFRCTVKNVYKNKTIKEAEFKTYDLAIYGDKYAKFYNVPDNKIFHTKEEVIQEIERLKNENIQLYKEKIKTIEDLLKFPFDYSFSVENEVYMNEEAQQAYIERAKELLNVDITL